MRHSDSLLQVITQGKRIRAFLSEELNIQEVKKYFGEEVTIDGIAHFNPKGELASFEVKKIRLAKSSDNYFKKIPQPVQQRIELKELAHEQDYKGTSLSDVIGKWPGDEDIDDLLEMID